MSESLTTVPLSDANSSSNNDNFSSFVNPPSPGPASSDSDSDFASCNSAEEIHIPDNGGVEKGENEGRAARNDSDLFYSSCQSKEESERCADLLRSIAIEELPSVNYSALTDETNTTVKIRSSNIESHDLYEGEEEEEESNFILRRMCFSLCFKK
uniref:Uncharacterized protein n=1 Tax=Ditylum brightwellii TaxID=49249 RepID=A0A7S2EJY3_9STRA